MLLYTGYSGFAKRQQLANLYVKKCMLQWCLGGNHILPWREVSVSVNDRNQTLFDQTLGISDYTSEINHVWKSTTFHREIHGIHNQCNFCLSLRPSFTACPLPRLQLNAITLLAQSLLFWSGRTLPVVVVTIKTNYFNFLVSYFIHLL